MHQYKKGGLKEGVWFARLGSCSKATVRHERPPGDRAQFDWSRLIMSLLMAWSQQFTVFQWYFQRQERKLSVFLSESRCCSHLRNSTREIIATVEALYCRITDRSTGIRRVDVCANRIASESYVQCCLFDDPKLTDKKRHLQEAVLNMKQRYGKKRYYAEIQSVRLFHLQRTQWTDWWPPGIVCTFCSTSGTRWNRSTPRDSLWT